MLAIIYHVNCGTQLMDGNDVDVHDVAPLIIDTIGGLDNTSKYLHVFFQLMYLGKGGSLIARFENKLDVLSSFELPLLRLGDLDFFETGGAFVVLFRGIFALMYPVSLSTSLF
jgi:hypothetical protein